MAEITTSPELVNQEIAELEAKLAAKRESLNRSGVESPERTVFKEVIREHASGSEQQKVVIPVAPAATKSGSGSTSRAVTDEDERKVTVLIAHAFTKGIASAVAEAQRMGDDFFVDLLHDRLADEYYQKLISARKIKS